MKLFGLFLISIYLNRIDGTEDKAKRYCGVELNNILLKTCTDGFNSLPLNITKAQYEYILPAIETDIRYPYIPDSITDFFEFKEESVVEKKSEDIINGIVEECCKLGCTHEQLRQYCSLRVNDPKSINNNI